MGVTFCNDETLPIIQECNKKNLIVRARARPTRKGKGRNPPPEPEITAATFQKTEKRQEQYSKFTEKEGNPQKSKSLAAKPILSLNIELFFKDALHSMQNNEMLNALYSHHIERLLEQPSPPLNFLKVALEKTITGKSFNIEAMWVEFNKVWTDGTITTNLQSCLSVSKDFCSWILLTSQEVVAKSFNTKKKEDTEILTAQITTDEKDTVTYICGAVLRKVIQKSYDDMRKSDAKHPSRSILQQQILVLNFCKEESGNTEGSSKLIETLNRGGLIVPKKPLADIFLNVEKELRAFVKINKTEINGAEIISRSLSKSCLETFQRFSETVVVPDNIKLTTLKHCVTLYVKIRSYSHAKNLVEYHRETSKKKRKAKALRKNL